LRLSYDEETRRQKRNSHNHRYDDVLFHMSSIRLASFRVTSRMVIEYSSKVL
jgi:hypothetical protein